MYLLMKYLMQLSNTGKKKGEMSVIFISALGDCLGVFFSCNRVLSGKAPLNSMDMESVQSQGM